LAARLQAALNQSVTDFQLPGAVLAVRSPDSRIWTGTSGLARVADAVFVDGVPTGDENIPMSLDLHFHISSLTKSFTATIILQLVDEGKLALDDTVEQVIPHWLPEYFDFVIPYANAITVRYSGYDIAILENGKIQQTGEPIGIPSRAILFRVMKVPGSAESP
jgi:CubicO group peptidase (beta-lactamase class C family)